MQTDKHTRRAVASRAPPPPPPPTIDRFDLSFILTPIFSRASFFISPLFAPKTRIGASRPGGRRHSSEGENLLLSLTSGAAFSLCSRVVNKCRAEESERAEAHASRPSSILQRFRHHPLEIGLHFGPARCHLRAAQQLGPLGPLAQLGRTRVRSRPAARVRRDNGGAGEAPPT